MFTHLGQSFSEIRNFNELGNEYTQALKLSQ